MVQIFLAAAEGSSLLLLLILVLASSSLLVLAMVSLSSAEELKKRRRRNPWFVRQQERPGFLAVLLVRHRSNEICLDFWIRSLSRHQKATDRCRNNVRRVELESGMIDSLGIVFG